MDGFNLGDLISLIIVFVLYLAAASGKAKKGKKGAGNRARRSPVRTRVQGEQADRRVHAHDRQTHTDFSDVSEIKEYVEKQTAHQPCDGERIHLHEVSQQQFAWAVEGEDPCHAGGADSQDSTSFDFQHDVNGDGLAQDVLRGVIMSEILRPHAAARRGRR